MLNRTKNHARRTHENQCDANNVRDVMVSSVGRRSMLLRRKQAQKQSEPCDDEPKSHNG